MNFEDMTDEEINDLIEAMKQEVAQRQTRRVVDSQLATIIEQYREGQGPEAVPAPESEWVQPPDAARSYVQGEVVEQDGQLFESAVSCNMCAPNGHCSHEAWKKI